MNFGREMSLLRIRLTEAGSPESAARRQAELGGNAAFLGAAPKEIDAAASDLVTTYPEMGRAQMTAFVRTLWQSNVHELQAVGIRILASRASLLEPHDLPFVEGLLKKCDTEPVAETLASDVLGVLATKNKKLWKDLRRLAGHADVRLRRAAVRACREPLLADETAFERFVDIVDPLFQTGDADVLQTIDEVLAAIANVHDDAVRELAARHGRKIRAPKPKKKASKKAAASAGKPAVKKKAAAKKAAKKTVAKKPAKKAAKKTS
ncbi:MAG: DNA alkylation repair protein [Planctomycetes bacterium]|nr:DNA alkylation repair protein [Planctomycetota bacterium]